MLGCVDQVGDQGANIALVSKLHAGVADDAYAFTLNNYCVSGLTAIGHAATQVAAGNLDRALAGGVEMMSRVPFLGDKASYYTDASFPKRTRFIPVVLAADRLAEARRRFPRANSMRLRSTSQQRAGAAEANPALTASRIAARWLEPSTNAPGRSPPPNHWPRCRRALRLWPRNTPTRSTARSIIATRSVTRRRSATAPDSR